jgi:hypothetical protein
MREALISLETAKLAKEKGFNLYSPAWYSCDDPSGDLEPNRQIIRSYATWDELGTEDDQVGTEIYSAPTQAQLQKWLREEHSIDLWFGQLNPPNKYHVEDIVQDDVIIGGVIGGEPNYENALEKGLLEALKLI